MDKVQKQVREFHRAFGVPAEETPQALNVFSAARRMALMQEELGEFCHAWLTDDVTEMVDALGDLLYVTYGCAVEMGVDMEPIMDAIQASNMSKLGLDGKPVKTPNGKIGKGPRFFKPNILAELQKQQTTRVE